MRIRNCIIFVHHEGQCEADVGDATHSGSTASIGIIHIEPGGELQINNVLIFGSSPTPLISVARGGSLTACNSVIGPNGPHSGAFYPAGQQQQQQQPQPAAAWCVCASGTLAAQHCSFIGGAAGCLSLLDGAAADLTQCHVAASAAGKGAELRGANTALTASSCAFRDNHLAGCAVLDGACAAFRSCRFTHAVESGGLAVHGEDSTAAAEGCLFSGNSRSGLYVSSGGHVELTGCKVSNNRRYAGMEVKGPGAVARCRGCSFVGNVRAEVYALAGAVVTLDGGEVMVREEPAAEHSVWARDPGTVVEMRGVAVAIPPSLWDGAEVRLAGDAR